jgi:hypothetical protein
VDARPLPGGASPDRCAPHRRLGVDIARRALRTLYLGAAIQRLGTDVPWIGPARFAAILSQSLFLAWPAALVGAALVVFLHRSAWPAVAAYGASIAAIVVLHPIAGNGSLAQALTAAQLAAVLASLGCGLTWYWRPTKAPTSTAQAALALIVGVELTTLAFAWRAGIFANWHLSQAIYVVMYGQLFQVAGVRPRSIPSLRTQVSEAKSELTAERVSRSVEPM